MWLRNPVSLVYSTEELAIACDFNSGERFFYLRSCEAMIDYFNYWEITRFLDLNYQNQSLCQNTVFYKNAFKGLGLRVRYLEMDSYFGDICKRRRNMREIYSMRSSCCENNAHKVHDLRLFLDDWRNFTALSADNVNSKESFFTWRAPNKCQSIRVK